MATVRNIQELFDWQARMDSQATTLKDATQVTHPEANLNLRALRLINPNNTGDCAACGEPEFIIRDKGSGRTGAICRACINAVRRQSLLHTQYGTGEICLDCTITTDSLGIIDGAIHRTKPVEDEPQQNGTIRQGIGPKLRAGKINLTGDVLTIS